MRIFWYKVILALSLSLCGPSLKANAQDMASPPSEETWNREVVIKANFQGPAMWRVTKGKSQVYILGAMPIMTKRIPWDQARVEKIIKQSNLLLTTPEARIGPIALTRLQLDKRLPLGQKLDEVLPPDVSKRFYALVEAHGLDRKRYKTASPLWAVAALRQDIYDKNNIATRDPEKTLIRLAKAQNLKTKPVGSFSASKAISKVANFSRAEDLACVRATLDEIEFSLLHAKTATEAWAVADLKSVQRLSPDSAMLACLEGAKSTSAMLDSTIDQTVDSINVALEAPGRSLMVLPLSALLSQNGALKRLESQGAIISIPEL
jgi:uncharacterized protein YbaP (TraB family)